MLSLILLQGFSVISHETATFAHPSFGQATTEETMTIIVTCTRRIGNKLSNI
jgi:hypothetical protein